MSRSRELQRFEPGPQSYGYPNGSACLFDPADAIIRETEARAEKAEARVRELRKQRDTARAMIQFDRTGLADGLGSVHRIVTSYQWLAADDCWGSYECDEQTIETLRREIGDALNAILEAAVTSLRKSGDRADQAFNGPFDVVVEKTRTEQREAELAAAKARVRELQEAIRLSLKRAGEFDGDWDKRSLAFAGILEAAL